MNKIDRINLFIEHAKRKHDNIYDYTLVYDTYTTLGASCTIICPEHGEFETTPANHKRGYGKCPKCYPIGIKQRRVESNERLKQKWNNYMQRCNKIHDFKYDYSKVNFKTMHKKVIIICPNHGEFEQTISDHIHRKAGCPSCAGNAIRSFDQWIREVKTIHSNKYEYKPPSTTLVNNSDFITAICSTHGEFKTNVSNHLHLSAGCPECGNMRSGYCIYDEETEDAKTPTTLYLVEFSSSDNSEKFVKIGITKQNITTRFHKNPYNYKIIQQLKFPSRFKAQRIEQAIIQKYQHLSYTPKLHFAGHTECFSVNILPMSLTDIEPTNQFIIPLSNARGYSFMKNIKTKYPEVQMFFNDEINFFRKSNNVEKIYARKTKIKEIDRDQYNTFLSSNHIQGQDFQSSVRIGLFFNDELIQVMGFGTPRFNKNCQWELIRLATKQTCRVVGGSSKIFKYFIKKYQPTSIISYCDWRLFNGSVYQKLGFEYIRTTSPSYYYVKNHQRYNRLHYQKHLLSEKLNNFDPQLSEKINMENNGFYRIYDAGQKVFMWKRLPPFK